MNDRIYVGIDDTDTEESRGTNQLAKALVRELAADFDCIWIVRHQLFFDPRIPYTSQNGSASLVLESRGKQSATELAERLETLMRADFIPGSDPGLSIAQKVPDAITEFAHRCQREVVTQSDARELASAYGIFLKGLGGTEGGVIGALAAIGLGVEGNDGRVVQVGTWSEELCNVQSLAAIHDRQVEVRELSSGSAVTSGLVDVGKKLRPNLRDGRFVLFVEPSPVGSAAPWKAVKIK